jgi:putative salt-induced outer membrane protein YdiY
MRPATLILAALIIGVAGSARAQTPSPLWEVQVGGSFVGTSGNSDTTTTGADFSANRRGAAWQIESTATAVRTSTDGVTTGERYLGHVRGNHDVSPLLGLTTGIDLERDEFSGIEFRSILDGGLSWRFVRSTGWTLTGVTSLAWNHENPTDDQTRDDPVGVLQLLSRIPFANGDTTQRITLYPDFSDGSASRSEIELTAQAAMTTHLALKFGYLLRYSHDPEPGFKRVDNTTTVSVVLRWKAAKPAVK